MFKWFWYKSIVFEKNQVVKNSLGGYYNYWTSLTLVLFLFRPKGKVLFRAKKPVKWGQFQSTWRLCESPARDPTFSILFEIEGNINWLIFFSKKVFKMRKVVIFPTNKPHRNIQLVLVFSGHLCIWKKLISQFALTRSIIGSS